VAIALSEQAFLVRGVTKVYGSGPGEVQALRGIDLDVWVLNR
jgi:hypothetical protein